LIDTGTSATRGSTTIQEIAIYRLQCGLITEVWGIWTAADWWLDDAAAGGLA